MAVTIEISFTHNKFHASPWDKATNSGTVEWPPSPWRIARALIAVWYERQPDIPGEVIGRVLDALRGEPHYQLPEVRPGHTRHYMPNDSHRSNQTDATTKYLDTFLTLDSQTPITVSWPQANLSDTDRDHLATLLSSMAYLGRAESRCDARLVNTPGVLTHDSTAHTSRMLVAPNPAGTSRVLCVGEATQTDLMMSPASMRKKKTLQPPGSVWVNYHLPEPAVTAANYQPPQVHAVRWTLHTKAPFLESKAILATEALRKTMLRYAVGGKQPDDAWMLHGHNLQRDDHQHAHWLWIPENGSREVVDLVLWVPYGIPSKYLKKFGAKPSLDPWHQSDPKLSDSAPRDRGYRPDGFVNGTLQLQRSGNIAHVAPELVADTPGARMWQSATPYLRQMHTKKNRNDAELLTADVNRELRYRFGDDAPAATVVDLVANEQADDADVRWLRRTRTYRWFSKRPTSKPATLIQIELDRPVAGPLILGSLSHLGFGVMRPIRTSDAHMP